MEQLHTPMPTDIDVPACLHVAMPCQWHARQPAPSHSVTDRVQYLGEDLLQEGTDIQCRLHVFGGA